MELDALWLNGVVKDLERDLEAKDEEINILRKHMMLEAHEMRNVEQEIAVAKKKFCD